MEQNEKTINQQLRDAEIPLDSHESDLYAKDTPESRKIIAGWEFYGNVTRFRSQIDGEMWYDIPFAFEPYWEKRGS